MRRARTSHSRLSGTDGRHLPDHILGTAVGDASGNSSFSLAVPAGAAGLTVLFQAVELTTCKVSNLTSTTF